MLVRCDKCQTEFGLDDRQVPPDGVTARCSVCGHVFHVRPATGSGGDRPWQIRTADGLLFAAPDMTTLKTWIAEGRLTPDDEVSRSGQVWLRLGDMPELTPLFGLAGGIIESVEAPAADAAAGDSSDAEATLPPPPDFAAALRDDDEDDDAQDAPTWRRAEVGALASGGGVPRSGPAPAATPPGVAEPIEPEPSGSLLGVVSAHVASGAVKAADQRLAVYDASLGAPRYLEDEPPSGIVAEGSSATAATNVSADPVGSSGAQRGSRPASAAAAAAAHTSAADHREADRGPAITAEPSRAVPIADFDDDAPPTRRRGRGLWVAAAGLLIGVGVVFGHPAIRAQVLSLGTTPADASDAPASAAPAAQTAAVDDAIVTGSLASLARVEADVQRALDRGEGSDVARAELAVLLADVLSTRSLLYSMTAVVDDARTETLRESARDDLTRAAQLVADVKAVPSHLVDRVGVVRAQVRLAQGRAATDILPLLPTEHDDAATTARVDDVRALTAVHPAWTSADASLATADVETIVRRANEASASGVVIGAAMVASLRSGDVERAEALRTSLETRASDHPLAKVELSSAGVDSNDGKGQDGKGGAPLAASKAKGTGEVGEATPGGSSSPVANRPAAGAKPSSGGGGGSVDALLDRGCAQVESGSASAGVSTLLKAFDLDPTNVDVNVCLGAGYAKLKNHGRALHFFEKALATSPKHRAALEGAADAAAKSGSSGKAKRLYERLLAVDPGNADAKAYLEAQGDDASSTKASDASGAQGGSPSAPEPAKPVTPPPDAPSDPP